MSLRSLKWAAILCFVVAMAILLGGGIAMKKELPPYPGKVVGAGGNLLFEKADIMAGQNVYQRYGLMDHGAVWGHGSQRGPEFSAASLHIMAEAIGDYFAQKDHGKPYNDLDDLQKGIIDVKTTHEIKPNRYESDPNRLSRHRKNNRRPGSIRPTGLAVDGRGRGNRAASRKVDRRDICPRR